MSMDLQQYCCICTKSMVRRETSQPCGRWFVSWSIASVDRCSSADTTSTTPSSWTMTSITRPHTPQQRAQGGLDSFDRSAQFDAPVVDERCPSMTSLFFLPTNQPLYVSVMSADICIMAYRCPWPGGHLLVDIPMGQSCCSLCSAIAARSATPWTVT